MCNFDFSKSLLFANTFSGPPPESTLHWCSENFGARAYAYSKAVPLICARNSMVRDALALADKDTEWIFFIDNDVGTLPSINSFLELEGELVSCECKCRNHTAWNDPFAFHCNFWRVRPYVLTAIESPWFELNISKDGCDLISCECKSLQNKALAKEFKVTHGGWCSHSQQGDWLKQGDGKLQQAK